MKSNFAFAIFVTLGLTLACRADPLEQQSSASDQSTSSAVTRENNCPDESTPVALKPPRPDTPLRQQLIFRPTAIEATADTLTFSTPYYRFIFCQSNQNWTVQAQAPTEAASVSPQSNENYQNQIRNPQYESIDLNGQTYRARVRLEAAWLSASTSTPATVPEGQERVIFELIKPGETQPTQTILYTQADVERRRFGISLGVPKISQGLAEGESLWWSIGFEQGEGNSGIGTLVQYQPAADQVKIWQPQALGNAQITDLAITPTETGITLWLGTQYSGEGNPQLPAMGLVSYEPDTDTLETYTVQNSPLIGAIPTRLWRDQETLWMGTPDGACAVQWAAIQSPDSWTCWRFSAIATLPPNGIPLYKSLLAKTPLTQLTADTVEVLWLAETDLNAADRYATARYEVRYQPGLELTLALGASLESGELLWPGTDWHWNGVRFVRSHDEIAENLFGLGPRGLGPPDDTDFVFDWNVMRGDFDLIALTPYETQIRHYSAWVKATDLQPYVTVIPQEIPAQRQVNPLEQVKIQLIQPN